MNCRETQDILVTDFIDGVLASEKQKQVEEHLMSCVKCRTVFNAARQVDLALKCGTLSDVPSARVWDNIMAKINEKPLSLKEILLGYWESFAWGFRPKFVYGGFAAGILVLVMLVVPISAHRQKMLAKADQEILLALVYPEDSMVSVDDLTQAESGSVVDGLL